MTKRKPAGIVRNYGLPCQDKSPREIRSDVWWMVACLWAFTLGLVLGVFLPYI